MDDVNIHIDELVLDADHSLDAGLRERLGAVLSPADLDPVSQAVAEVVQRHADRAAPGLGNSVAGAVSR